MKMKKYEVSDMKEAIRLIKEDLGPDAVILDTKRVMKHQNLGLLAKPTLVVTAVADYGDRKPESVNAKTLNKERRSIDISVTDDGAIDMSTGRRGGKISDRSDDEIISDLASHTLSLADQERMKPAPTFYADNYLRQPRRQAAETVELKPIGEVKKEKEGDNFSNVINSLGLDRFSNLLQDVSDIKRQLSELKHEKPVVAAMDINSRLKDAYQSMCKNGVDEVISYRFLKNAEKRMADNLSNIQIKNMLIESLAEMITIERNYFDALKNGVVALVGPTGVGKTTTLAKMAANLKLKHNMNVALITIDNFRIGAVEQLKTYAEIIGTPLYTASSQNELKSLVRDLKKEYDFVLIDSMGRSQFDTKEISMIKSFVEVDPGISVALVLSLASNQSELLDTLERYLIIAPNYIIFTKLDETRYFGSLINIPVKKKIPLLLVTTGQNVPDDMEVPDGKKIAKKVLQDIPSLWLDRRQSENI